MLIKNTVVKFQNPITFF